jgi:Flp pilus assembly pilin Flp
MAHLSGEATLDYEEAQTMRVIRKFGTILWHNDFWRDERGQEFLEYALLCAFLAAVGVSCLGAIAATAERLGTVMQMLGVAIARLSPPA